jgi:hypothetical protein
MQDLRSYHTDQKQALNAATIGLSSLTKQARVKLLILLVLLIYAESMSIKDPSNALLYLRILVFTKPAQVLTKDYNS